MMRKHLQLHNRLLSLMLGMAIAALPACGGDNLAPPTEGAIRIITTTTGSDLDPDGYSVTVDDQPEEAVGIVDELTVSDLSLGDHNVTLTGVVQNCSLGGAGSRTVNVVGGDTTNVTFRVSCESIAPAPPPGDGGGVAP